MGLQAVRDRLRFSYNMPHLFAPLFLAFFPHLPRLPPLASSSSSLFSFSPPRPGAYTVKITKTLTCTTPSFTSSVPSPSSSSKSPSPLPSSPRLPLLSFYAPLAAPYIATKRSNLSCANLCINVLLIVRPFLFSSKARTTEQGKKKKLRQHDQRPSQFSQPPKRNTSEP